MNPLEIVVTAASLFLILGGMIATALALRVVDDKKRVRAFVRAVCIMFSGILVGSVGLAIVTGGPVPGVVVGLAAVAIIAAAMWRYRAIQSRGARRHDTGRP